MTAWGNWDEAAFDVYLPSNMVLGMADIAVVVTDRLSNLLYMNEYAARLFQVHPDAARLAGQPVLSLGLIADKDLRQLEDLTAQVLRGRSWEGTFESFRGDGLHTLIRTLVVPLRHPAGDIDGMVFLAREVGQRAGRSEEDRLALLERVGERLAGSLEIGTTLRHVAEMLVPQFADHCFIDLFQGDVLVRRVQRHADDWMPPEGTWTQTGAQIHYPEGHFCQQAMARLDTVVVPDLEEVQFPAPSAASLNAAHQAGLTSAMAAPLYARGVLLGVMSIALSRLTDRTEHHYDTPDGDLIGAIASRVAIAIDNAMLFEAERQTALAFQKSLLPQAIPELDGLEVACRYVPAKPLETQGQGIQTQVGGDWYDIIPLAAGRVGIVIGDVEGRGARAAAIMGQLRAALRAFAQDEKAPADIMRKLDEWCRSLAPSGADPGADPPTASCIYMIYDAWSRELTFANAGHDAPMLVSNGEARQLEFRHKGVLLGVRGRGIRGLPTYKEETIMVPPGAVMVFYTDGLTDRRTRADGVGHYTEDEAAEMLRHAVRAAAASGDPDVVATAAEYAVPGDIDDDMAILVARSSPVELASVEQVFLAEPIMVSEARRLAAETFKSWGMDAEQTELACLLVSEVVTNAVLHASTTPSPQRRFDLELEPVPVPVPVRTSAVGRAKAWDAVLTEARQGGADQGNEPAKEFALRLRRGANSVWVEVFDPDLRLPRLRTAGETDEGGRGLYLVEQLATRWGSRPTPEGKAVWFEMPRGSGSGSLRLAAAVVRCPQHQDEENEHDDRARPVFPGDGQLHLAPQPRPEVREAAREQQQQNESCGHTRLLYPICPDQVP
jgi:serine phosphatase RsbU (regulator of sigma subunit)